jgi:hypothetical protein
LSDIKAISQLKHVVNQGQYGGDITKNEFADHIEAVIDDPTMSKPLDRGRSAYYDEASGTVVIVDPSSADFGTAFVPRKGVIYYHELE